MIAPEGARDAGCEAVDEWTKDRLDFVLSTEERNDLADHILAAVMPHFAFAAQADAWDEGAKARAMDAVLRRSLEETLASNPHRRKSKHG